jgi:hypothetical protein
MSISLEVSDISCGIWNLFDLQWPASREELVCDVLDEILLQEGSGDLNDLEDAALLPFVIFSDVYRTGQKSRSPGQKLAEYIEQNPQLGVIRRSSVLKNPNTDNPIAIWVWEVAWKGVVDLYKNNLGKGLKVAQPKKVRESKW